LSFTIPPNVKLIIWLLLATAAGFGSNKILDNISSEETILEMAEFIEYERDANSLLLGFHALHQMSATELGAQKLSKNKHVIKRLAYYLNHDNLSYRIQAGSIIANIAGQAETRRELFNSIDLHNWMKSIDLSAMGKETAVYSRILETIGIMLINFSYDESLRKQIIEYGGLQQIPALIYQGEPILKIHAAKLLYHLGSEKNILNKVLWFELPKHAMELMNGTDTEKHYAIMGLKNLLNNYPNEITPMVPPDILKIVQEYDAQSGYKFMSIKPLLEVSMYVPITAATWSLLRYGIKIWRTKQIFTLLTATATMLKSVLGTELLVTTTVLAPPTSPLYEYLLGNNTVIKDPKYIQLYYSGGLAIVIAALGLTARFLPYSWLPTLLSVISYVHFKYPELTSELAEGFRPNDFEAAEKELPTAIIRANSQKNQKP